MNTETPKHDDFNLKKYKGLSSAQVLRRQKKYGSNELPRGESRTLLNIAFTIITEPMIMLLLACGIIYFILGDIEEAFVLLGCIVVIIAITVFQEYKTERALKALRDLSSPRALVIRDGEQKKIAGHELTVDDIIILNEGDRVPADAVMVFCSNLSADESTLTGESVPVNKTYCHGDLEMSKPGGDNNPFVFSGTLIVKGFGVAKIKKIGADTEIGKIGRALNETGSESTRLQKEIKKLVATIAVIGLGLCVLVAVFYSITRNDWLNGFLSGLALAMGILPEEFPLVLTIFLALGAWRISKNRVLTRKLPAIENLGSANVICVDKTGTLTLNKMSVKMLYVGSKTYALKGELPKNFLEIAEYAELTTHQDPFEPMEAAIKEFGKKHLGKNLGKFSDWSLVHEYPLSKELLAISHVWKISENSRYAVAAKGAPEAIIDLCHMSEEEKAQVLIQVDEMAKQGMRVLGIAKADLKEASIPQSQHDINFKFLGLYGLADTVRPGVKESLKHCYNAGIRVIMITGDYHLTAQNIAEQIGIQNFQKYITGPEMDKMTDEELTEKIRHTNIFARMVPEQKLRIIKALKDNNLIAAMTGDGVNDAPALKAADIGIAMGGKGTDVARESADLVLMDDDFSSIVQSVKMGRTIFDNLKKAMSYIVAIHIPIAGISLIPVLLKWPLVLLPLHIVFMELVVDPACSLVFESSPSEQNVMNRPPRNLQSSLFSRRAIYFSILQGLISLMVIMLIFIIAYYRGDSENNVRTMTFASLVITNMGLIFVNFSWTKNLISSMRSSHKTFWLIQLFTFSFLMAVIYIPYLNELFKFSFLSLKDFSVVVLLSMVVVLMLELVKSIRFENNQ